MRPVSIKYYSEAEAVDEVYAEMRRARRIFQEVLWE